MKRTRKVNSQIFSVNTNAKTVKGDKYGFLTGVLYLAPANESGYNVCPSASKGCTAACLFTAGRGKMSPVRAARVEKTKLFFENRPVFWDCVVWGIDAILRKAKREKKTPVIRMNGTSDLPWERIKVQTSDGATAENIFALYPDVQFYDYTKVPNRRDVPANYHLSFSLSESNDDAARAELARGRSVVVVFDRVKGEELPEKFWGAPVVDGDVSDLRFLDPSGSIIGLRAKGDAKGDGSGFVRSADFVELATV